MLAPVMSTSALPQSMDQSTAPSCGGLSTSGPTLENDSSTGAQSLPDQSKQIAYAIWIYMGPVIFIVGLTGNVFILIVMGCRRMRGTSTSDYLIIMAVADLLTITSGMIPEWLEAMGIIILQEWNPAMCKIYKFVSYMCGDTATWIRVLFTLDRFMAICFPMKKTDCCLAWRAKYYCLGAALAAIAKNMHVFWTRGAEYETKPVYEYIDCVKVSTNRTTTVLKLNCGYPTPEYRYFETYVRPWIVFTLVNLIPFCIILVCNIFIVRAMIQMTRMRKERRLPSKTSDWQLFQTTAMCLGASFTFLICVTPTMVLLIGRPYWTANGTNMVYEIAKSISNQLLYLNNSVNFFLYCITGKKFRETLGLMLRCRCREVMCKSDASASRAATVSPGSVAAIVGAAGASIGVRGLGNGRQNAKPAGYHRENSVQSGGLDLESLEKKRTVLDKIEESVVVVEDTDGKATVLEREEGIVMEDVVVAHLVESVEETRDRGDETLTLRRSGSESSSGVSSSTSNGEQSPTALNAIDEGGDGSQDICCASGNQYLANGEPCPKDKGHAEEGRHDRDQRNAVERCDTNNDEEHCSMALHCNVVNEDPTYEGRNMTHATTSDCHVTDQSLVKGHDLEPSQRSAKTHGLVKDHRLAKDYYSVITHNSTDIRPHRTNSSMTDQTNTSVNDDSCELSLTNSKLVNNNRTIRNVSSSNADNCELLKSLGSEGKNTSQTSCEEQNYDLEQIKPDNDCSVGIASDDNKCCGSNSHAEIARSEKLAKINGGCEDTPNETAERKKDVVNELESNGTVRKYTKDELLDKLPEIFC